MEIYGFCVGNARCRAFSFSHLPSRQMRIFYCPQKISLCKDEKAVCATRKSPIFGSIMQKTGYIFRFMKKLVQNYPLFFGYNDVIIKKALFQHSVDF